MKNKSLHKVERILLVFGSILLLAVLFSSGLSHNQEISLRNENFYTVIHNVNYEQKEDKNTPTGVVNEYRFTLKDVEDTDTLVFFINHHMIDVYVEETCIYHIEGKKDSIDTPGGVWSMIPLCQEDSGKEIRVVLTPVYKNYQDKSTEFMVGSSLEIYQDVFFKALYELILSLCTILAGVFLLCLAINHSIKHYTIFRLYAIGMLAISAGIWRITYGSYIYLVFREHTVLLYTLSVISLMVVALSMLNCVEIRENQKWERWIRYGSVLYGVMYCVQFLLQLLGILDLRQMLRLTHLTIICSAATLCISDIFPGIQKGHQAKQRNYAWILGVGAISDLILYYRAKTSSTMMFTLCAILCFSIWEGTRLIISFLEQKNALEEMETKLTLSRTTTMMSQIRSHFVFNILNAISGMCKYDAEKADDTIVRFARYLRSNIDIMENDKNIPFTTDLRQLEDYVILEQIRFGDKLQFYTEIETDQFVIPPLILQPVVENAIKHGVSKKQTGGTIVLKTREEKRHIVITVQDDGVGFSKEELEKETSVGIKNIRFRLEHLVNGTMNIESEKGVGTTVTITIPKEEKKHEDNLCR